MKNVKIIGMLLVTISVLTGFTQAASKEGKPDGTVRFSGGSVAAGIGFSWGKGTLTYKGKDYPVAVNGLSLGKVGITGVTASGEVYNLKKLEDFDGNYNAAGVGLTLAGGRSGTAMKNQNGVRVVVSTTARGADITIGTGGVKMRIKK